MTFLHNLRYCAYILNNECFFALHGFSFYLYIILIYKKKTVIACILFSRKGALTKLNQFVLYIFFLKLNPNSFSNYIFYFF